MDPGGAVRATGIDRVYVRRPERSCEAVPTGSNTPVRVPGPHGGQHVMMGTSLWHDGGSLVWGDRRTRKSSGPPHGAQRRSCAGGGPVGGGSRCGPLSAAGALLGYAAKSVLMCVSTLRRLGLRLP